MQWHTAASGGAANIANRIMAAYPRRTGARSESCHALHPIPTPPATPTRRRRPCMLRPAALCRQKVDFAGPNTEPHHGPAGKLRPQTRLHPAARPFHPSIHDPPDTQKPRVSYYSCCAIDLYSLAMHAAACPRLRLRPRAATGRASSSQPLPALLLATGADH